MTQAPTKLKSLAGAQAVATGTPLAKALSPGLSDARMPGLAAVHASSCASSLALALLLSACSASAPPGGTGQGEAPQASAQPTKPVIECGALAALALPATTSLTARPVPAGAEQAGNVPMPAHCLLRGEIEARTGVGGVRHATTMELRLPLAWNGRFQFMGGGGTDGSVRPAHGFAGNGSRPALADGYAVASSDFGHQATDPRDASFGLDPQARIDWGYRSLDLVTQRAKAVINAYYGRAPRYSYYAGCSGGGRQALVASQRFAAEYDGVMAGAPILEQHVAQIGSMQILQAFTAIAPAGADGKPVLSRAFSDADLALIQRDVLARCDALDGHADGSIDNPGACHWRPDALQCTGAKNQQCLTPAQVKALSTVLDGPKDSTGRRLYEPYPIDAGVITWRAAMLGTSPTGTPNASRATNTSVKLVFMTPPAPEFDYLKFDFDRDPARLAASASVTAANSTDYRAFRARGGKALIYMGTGDGLLNANGVRQWYERLAAAHGGHEATQSFARYFAVPGMGHCGGGPALDQFDPFGALVAWVEWGVAPDRLLAQGAAFPGRTRPLCAYPKQARYGGSGDADVAGSWGCVGP